MILPPNTASQPRAAALATRQLVRVQPGRTSTVKVNALFGMGGTASSGSNEAVLTLVNSKLGGPSEAGNDTVAEAVSSFGRVNKNPRSKDLYGQWGIVYASGNTGLTALDGKISKFTVTDDGTYENECSSKIAGIFPGSAKEGGQLKVTGGNKFELLQEYKEYSRPGGTAYEEVEEAPVRGFEVLALTDGALVMRLASTTFFDEDSSRRVTQVPEGDYFLVWRKEGAASTAVRAVQDDSVEVEEEVVQRTGSGSMFGGLFGGQKPASLATVAEKNLGGNSREDAMAAQRAAQEARQQAAMDRKAAALADKERRREEAEARKQEMQKRVRQGDAIGDATEIVTKPLFAFGGFSGPSKKTEKEEDSKTTGVAVKGLGSLFGSQKSAKRESVATGGDAAAQRKQEAADKKERTRQEAEERKRAQAAEREQKRAEAEAKKQEDAQKREQEAEMRRRIADVLAEMQNDVRDASLEVREKTMQLRTAERSGSTAMRSGSAAQRQLETAEAAFATAETGLSEANEIFNEIAGQLRAKESELNTAKAEARRLENNLLKKV